MYERTITIGSAGKAFSATGWKLGWSVGPEELLAPIKAVHQNCVYTCSTPTQVHCEKLNVTVFMLIIIERLVKIA